MNHCEPGGRAKNDLMSGVVEIPLAPCGHPHLTFTAMPGHRGLKPVLWRVVEPVEGYPPSDERDQKGVRLEPRTLLRHDQTDWTLQGCTGFEVYAFERFAVISGPFAGRCLEFSVTNPGYDDTGVPRGLQPA
jgi:hypothetical protein